MIEIITLIILVVIAQWVFEFTITKTENYIIFWYTSPSTRFYTYKKERIKIIWKI